MRGLVIVHERDRRRLGSLIGTDGQVVSDIFDIANCTFEFCRFHTDNGGVLRDADGRTVTVAQVVQRCSVVVLVAGGYAANDLSLQKILGEFLSGEESPAWSNETVVVIQTSPMARAPLQNLAPLRVFFTPSAGSGLATPQFLSDAWRRQVRAELEGLLRMIDENQTRNPNVGFGLLLLDSRCNCFLMERLREPGRGRLGTIGGNFERGHSIVRELTTVLARRFGEDGGPQVDLGPILSCTNMLNEFLHYIDLTFLAVIKGGTVADVQDEELRPLGPDILRYLPDHNADEPLMFTLSEVATFHREGLLFAPVANAFESLCRSIFTEQLRHGRRRQFVVPNLIDESRGLQLELPPDLDTVRHIVTAMPWSGSAPPFFEGDIS